TAKLIDDLWIHFVVAGCIERLRAVERALKTSRLIQSFSPHTCGLQLIARGMIRVTPRNLFKIFLSFVVVEIVERFNSSTAQFVELTLIFLRQPRLRRLLTADGEDDEQ